ncbi:MAG: amidohydrolase family protein, partial [Alphaproteobacteria bacterium]|nr:amidohydrolase family protein [Alphaproteobacteria bacterium]
LEIVAALNRAGVKVLSGTDTPNPYTYPGFSLHDELGLLVKAGFTPMAALQTATLNPAIFFGLRNTLGTVERGKVANLVLLDANPLEDINNTRRIAAVVVGGRYIPKVELERITDEVKSRANRR